MRAMPAGPAAILALVLAGCGCGREGEDAGRGEGAMKLTSTAFKAGDAIPRKYSGEGEDISPPLAWTGAPEGAREFALVCDDPDAPTPKPWVHWVVYRLPAGTTALAEGDPGGALEGRNDFGRTGYGGPMPPKGHGTHRYHFRIYALDAPLALEAGATKEELLAAMKGHVLAEGELVGTYKRR